MTQLNLTFPFYLAAPHEMEQSRFHLVITFCNNAHIRIQYLYTFYEATQRGSEVQVSLDIQSAALDS